MEVRPTISDGHPRLGRLSWLTDLDVTERQKAEDLVIRTERLEALSELAEGVAHSFQNVLQIVEGHAESALDAAMSGHVTELRACIEGILTSCRLGDRTVGRLRDYTGGRSKEMSQTVELFDLSRTVEQAVEISRPWWNTISRKANATIRAITHLQEGCLVTGRENQLFEVCINLIKNAVEALPQGGELEIQTVVRNDRVVLEIRDNGVGIPRKHIDKVFQPFWTTKGDSGTGLGLASSYGIVQAHGGEFQMESREGVGTVVSVQLPLAQRSPKPADIVREEGINMRCNILLVDDSADLLEAFGDWFTKKGQTVYKALSGREGIKGFFQARIDAVICDENMPDMKGRHVAEAIKDLCRERGIRTPPFILLSGGTAELEGLDQRRCSGVDRVLTKPVLMKDLLALVWHMVSQSRMRL